MTEYPEAAVERAMKLAEVLVKATAGNLSWLEAADILGYSPRHLRRLREEFEEHGAMGLVDKRTCRPSPRRAPLREVKMIIDLYRSTYDGFNVRHFYEIAKRDHSIRWSYNFVRGVLQDGGLVVRRKVRGRHLRRREPRACFGELLHIDGSPHAWLSLCPDERQTLIVSVDDATKDILYAQLWPGETTEAILSALRTIIEENGIPSALYSDRASWAFNTPKGGQKVDMEHLTQVGRALAKLGVEHIPAYSPQARGRSERLNRTLQDRLINELRVAGITTVEAANHYIRDIFIPDYRTKFLRPPRDPESAFVLAMSVDLDQILCVEEKRTVSPDNVVSLDNVKMQIEKQPGRRTCAGLAVLVRRHLTGQHTIWFGNKCLGVYDQEGKLLQAQRGLAA